MSVLKPRNRALVFRLTQEEYDALRATSIARGARNLSHFARSAVLATIPGNIDAADSLEDVHRAISDLQLVVRRITDMVDRMDGKLA